MQKMQRSYIAHMTISHTKSHITPKQFLEKIVVNVGVGRLGQQQNFEDKILVQVKRDLAAITGQAAHPRPSTRSIAGFRMREGQIVGLRVTLRGQKMVDFFTRLIMIVLPRVRDFRGIARTAVDAGGTLNLGITEHTVFPEINPEHSPMIFSLGISVVPKKRIRKEALEAYQAFEVPLTRDAK